MALECRCGREDRDHGPPTAPDETTEFPLWLRALPSGDVLLANGTASAEPDAGGGAVFLLGENIVRVFSGAPPSPPTIDWDGAMLFIRTTLHPRSAPSYELTRWDGHGVPVTGAIANGANVGSWCSPDGLAPVGDGTSVFVTSDPTDAAKQTLVRMRTTP